MSAALTVAWMASVMAESKVALWVASSVETMVAKWVASSAEKRADLMVA